MTLPIHRRRLILAAAALAMLDACTTSRPSDPGLPHIVFVHGNGDSAALWLTTVWRFESNGWPRDRLHAIDIPFPLARDDDSKPQPGRSSTADNLAYLSQQVDRVLAATGASTVVLIANSRGGNAVRNYVANGRGATKVSHAILCGTPNHGVYADPTRSPNAEFNGAGVFLSSLNAPRGMDGKEVPPGVAWMTIRSDDNDKYAQADGAWIGAKGTPTHVSAEGPALKGAENVVIPGIDHRETAYSPQAFAAMFRFITGRPPQTLEIAHEARVTLDGMVSGYVAYTAQGTVPTNLPLVGATVELYATNAANGERLGPAVHRKSIGPDGRWGPFEADGSAHYEFVISAPGYAATHIYRSPFPRTSTLVQLRAEQLLDTDKDAAAVVIMTRPRGYFGLPRDQVLLDGTQAPGIVPGVAGVASSKLKLSEAGRPVIGVFNGERIAGRSWPVANNAVTYLEMTS